MKFTGERMVLGETDWELEREHLDRYCFASQFVNGKDVLDAACGTGYGSLLMAHNAKSVCAIDISEESIAYAKTKNSAPNIDYLCASVTDIPYKNGAFDTVISYETLEHIDEQSQERFLNEIRRLIRPNGVLVISTPNHDIYKLRGKNEFHIRELTFSEFGQLLKKYFRNVYLFSQKWEVFDAIIGEHSSLANVKNGISVENSEYLIAVCSDQEINDIYPQLYIREDNRLAELMAWAVDNHNRNEQHNVHIVELDRSLIQIREENERLIQNKVNAAKEIQQLQDKENGYLSELVAEKQKIIDVLEKVNAIQCELYSVQADLAYEKKERSVLLKTLNTVTLENQAAQKTMDTLMQEKQAAENALCTMTQEKNNIWGEVLQLRDKENRYINELAALKASRTWRVGRFFSNFVRFFVPVGSKRAVFVRLLVTMIRHPRTFFSCLTPKKMKKFFRLMRNGNTESVQALIQMNLTGQPVPSQLEVMKPEIVPVEETAVQQKRKEDYPVLTVPQWENPQVSIVIPVYNQFEYTYRCVESILKNSGDITYEIIIGNDCSTDLTMEIDGILPGVRCITNEKNLRFVLNCNAAAKHAKGIYVLFLNNDTQVQPNWLEPLVTLIESSEDIGLVGSKLVYPDGTLQEAGGILWRDGSAWNFGNRQNPSDPQFNYVKEVDYISGASIMLRRALWEEIGGFDETFVPAYCDDSDLAFTVRKMGYRVMYQPKSVVVHFEGISNGTDTASGQKQYQVINSQKFFKKWEKELASHPENGQNVFQARERSYGKKTLLMVDHYVPHYDKDAGSRTVFQYLKLFVKLGFNVKFIGDNFYQHEPYTTTLQQMGIEVLYGPDCANNWEQWICDNGDMFDYVFLNRPHIAPKYMEAVRRFTKAKVVYYGHDLGFLREMREYEVTGDESFKLSSLEWQPKELDLMRKADMAYYPSYVEVDAIHALDSNIQVKAIPAYLFENVEWQGYDFNNRKDIMFIGGFSHRPNVDAVKWLAQEILPELLKFLPDIKLHILGSNAPQEVRDLACDNMIIHGFVTDEELEQFYRNCRISLVPLRYGAGIKGKVVEAMRYGTPVVTTTTGAEGIPNADRAMLIEDDAKVLAHKLAVLYQNEKGLVEMSKNCITYIQENYSPQNAICVIGPDFNLN